MRKELPSRELSQKETCKISLIPLRFPVLLLMLALLSLWFSSCSSTKEQVITWNVELEESQTPITNKCNPDVKLNSIKSSEKPFFIPETEDRSARIRVKSIPCSIGEEPPEYEVPLTRVKRITYVSDPLQPPLEITHKDLPEIKGCCRVRDGLWFFDKFEIRGAVGYRGSKDSAVYPSSTGQDVYKSSFIGFDRGGSSIVLGFEVVGLWNVSFIDKTKHFQMGVITGIWPVDGSLFAPVGLHLRYTFNQFPAKFSENCNSFYFYANAGLPLDFQTDAPLFGSSMDFQRYFYGFGIGHDWAINCDVDFSIDLGLRGMNLPLPPIECCPSIAYVDRNPFRKSTVLLLRFGLTF